MAYKSYVSPPIQDESGAVIKQYHICPTRGCGVVMDKDNKRCPDCGTAAERKIIEDEYDEKYAVKVASGIL